MGLIDQIKSDIEDITSNAEEFGWPLIFTTPDAAGTVTVTGLYTKHHIQIDPESGRQINVKNAHCSVSEKFFTAAGYPCRDANNEVQMKRHKVRTTDVSGITWDYVVQESFADETTGLIVFILGDFQQSA
jgi:hypothetical protein